VSCRDARGVNDSNRQHFSEAGAQASARSVNFWASGVSLLLALSFLSPYSAATVGLEGEADIVGTVSTQMSAPGHHGAPMEAKQKHARGGRD
jgi:hypothetical protein